MNSTIFPSGQAHPLYCIGTPRVSLKDAALPALAEYLKGRAG